LGEPLGRVTIGAGGIDGDRRFGVVDAATGLVASAKRPHRWRRLLLLRSEVAGPGVIAIHFPDGRSVLSTDGGVDKLLSDFLGEGVQLHAEAPRGAQLERAVPDAVLTDGPEADVEVTTLRIAEGSPAGTFFDFSPLQLITSASLERVRAAHPAGRIDVARYRPNVVIDTEAGLKGFVENDWVGSRLHLGPEVIVEVLIPSPRCAIPTLRHGDLPGDPDALRVPLAHNFVPIPLEGFGSAPCLGVHAAVFRGGWASPGDEVRLTRSER
jgi:uncharacterized protein